MSRVILLYKKVNASRTPNDFADDTVPKIVKNL